MRVRPLISTGDMSMSIVHKILIILIILFSPSLASAATVNAASCSKSDVETAIAAADPGDTVTVPSCSGGTAWSGAVTLAKSITIQGAGIDNTVIEDYGFSVSPGTDDWRITGFTFSGEGGSNRLLAISAVGAEDSGCKDFRVDHCEFRDNASNAIRVGGYSYGVLDNCEFTNLGGEALDYCADRGDAWSRSPYSGGYTNGTVFIEDCTFSLTTRDSANAIEANSGARWTIRYCTFTDSASYKWNRVMEWHGLCYRCNGYDARGTVSMEIYENTFTTNNSGTWNFLYSRGGGGVIYNNDFYGEWGTEIYMGNYRSNASACTSECSDQTTTTACCGEEDYPCLDQIGYDDNDLYIWDNSITDGVWTVSVNSAEYQPTHIQENRDYYLSAKSGYSPYTYPHPIRQEGSAIITGTATENITESAIVSGGKTIIVDLYGAEWVAAGATFEAQRQNIIDGITSAQSEGTGWNAEVRDKEVVGSVVRTDNDTVTITLSASASYNITANETITVTVPASATDYGVELVGYPTFQVSAEQAGSETTISTAGAVGGTAEYNAGGITIN